MNLYVPLSGLDASSAYLDVTANNISNANTFGYKTSQITFQDLLYQTEVPPGTPVTADMAIPIGTQIGLGVKVDALSGRFTQGAIAPTGVARDVAISGPGFFQVALPDGGTGYTRNGAFRQDAAGQIVTEDGFVLQPPIVVPPDATSLSIAADGTVSAITPAGVQNLGQITPASFVNPGGLLRIGNNLFVETAAAGPPTVGAPGSNGIGTLQQGALEQSNVDLTTELVNLLVAQQAFSINVRALTVQNEMLVATAELIV